MHLQVPNAIGFIMGTAQLILYAIYRRKTPPPKEAADLEAKVADRVLAQLEMAAKPNKGLQKGSSLPLKRTVSRQNSLTKIVKSLSLPPYEDSNWGLGDVHSEN